MTDHAAARARALLDARVGAHLTHEDLSARTGIDAARLRRFETGQDQPSMPDLLSVAVATGVPVSMVCGYEPAPQIMGSHPRTRASAAMERELRFFLSLDRYLADAGITPPA